MSLRSTRAVYTTGSIGGTMLKTALSMVAGTLAMSGYNIVDTYFVGQLGRLPLAAMGFTFPVIMLIGCVFRGGFQGCRQHLPLRNPITEKIFHKHPPFYK